MRILFQVCFGVGLGYSVISFVLGQVLGVIGGGADASVDADINLDGGLDAGMDAGLDGGPDGFGVDGAFDSGASTDVTQITGSVSPFKPTVIAAFLAVFGGIGMLLLPRFGIYFTLTAAAAAGFAAGYVIYRYVYVFLYKSQNTSTVDKQSLVGSNAKVTEAIPDGGYGKITYIVKNGTYTAPAKSEDNGALPRGADVEIVSIIKNTYYVRNKNK